MKKILALLILLYATSFAVKIGDKEYSEKDIKAMEDGLAEWRKTAQQASSMSPSEAIPKLGAGLRKTSQTVPYITGDRLGIRAELQQALLAIPGHAEYYGKILDRAAAAFEQDPTAFYTLYSGQSECIPVLKELPSAETVRVLGETLNDKRGIIEKKPDKSNLEEWLAQIPNCDIAMRTLKEMLEDTPPVTRFFNREKELPEWQQWYQQIKEGRRTFRFKGNPQEYNLNGPVNQAKNPDIPRDERHPDLKNSSTVSKSSPTTESPSEQTSQAPLWVIIGVVIAAVTGWFFLKRQQ